MQPPPSRRLADPAILFAQATQHLAAGNYGPAEALLGQVLALSPQHPGAGFNMAWLLVETGRGREAARRLARLLKSHPDDANAHYLMGRLLRQDGMTTRALYHFRRALALAPQDRSAWLDAIALLGEAGRLDDARAMAEQARTRFPTSPEVVTQMGLVLLHNGCRPEARAVFEQALQIDPTYPLATYTLATLYDDDLEIAAALPLYRHALAHDTGRILPETNLADIELRLGEVDAAIASSDAWLATHPTDPAAISNRLMAAQYVPGVTAASLRVLHDALWEGRVAAPLAPAVSPHQVTAAPDRPLRVGLVSGDLRAHPVGQFTIRAIEAIDRADCALIAYSGTRADDPIADRFRAAMSEWHDVAGWTDARLAEQIVRDRVDVLIDMSGHTTQVRLGAFARRPAPVQITWGGYFGTTGAAAIDWIIADRHLVPPGEEPAYRERILRLPDGYLCYDPPAAPHVSPDVSPVSTTGPVHLAAFHNPAKINPDVAALWARILRRIGPSARLHLTYAGYETAAVQSRVAGWFADAGVESAQLSFSAGLPYDRYLARLGEMDLALDPFPYSGGAITCDALWMGLPVVTLPGRSFAGRHAQSHLCAAGLGQFVAEDADHYVAIVESLATDRAARGQYRESLRAQVAGSPLCDGARFGGHLQAAIRFAWRDWCKASK